MPKRRPTKHFGNHHNVGTVTLIVINSDPNKYYSRKKHRVFSIQQHISSLRLSFVGIH